jgi:hypothetical protein
MDRLGSAVEAGVDQLLAESDDLVLIQIEDPRR